MEWYAEVDQFEVRLGVSVFTIVARQKLSTVDHTDGSQGLIYGPPSYSTIDGQAVERIDSRRFRVVGTSEVLERIRD